MPRLLLAACFAALCLAASVSYGGRERVCVVAATAPPRAVVACPTYLGHELTTTPLPFVARPGDEVVLSPRGVRRLE